MQSLLAIAFVKLHSYNTPQPKRFWLNRKKNLSRETDSFFCSIPFVPSAYLATSIRVFIPLIFSPEMSVSSCLTLLRDTDT